MTSPTSWEVEWRLLLTGPNNALFALEEGELELFRAEFDGPGATLDDEEIRRFGELVRERFGRFLKSESELDAPPEFEGPPPWRLGGYQTLFTSEEAGEWTGVVNATIGIERLPSGTLKLGWILLEGEGPTGEDVRIRYPDGAGGEDDSE